MRRRDRSRRDTPTEPCPHCGEPVRVGAVVCRHCGSDAQTGWADPDEIAYQSVDIPDVYGDDEPDPPRGRRVLAIILVVLLVLAIIRALT